MPGRQTELSPSAATIYLSYKRADQQEARLLASYINARLRMAKVVFDDELLRPGDNWRVRLRDALKEADVVILLISRAWLTSEPESFTFEEALEALRNGSRIVPVYLQTNPVDLPKAATSLRPLMDIQGVFWTNLADQLPLESLVRSLESILSEGRLASSMDVNPEDPQEGRWGGQPASRGRRLSATIREISSDWFEISLTVSSTSIAPLTGEVEFHLHPTFHPSVRRVPVSDNRASLTLQAWGGFTVGAVADGGATRLELNLAKLSDAPQLFKAR